MQIPRDFLEFLIGNTAKNNEKIEIFTYFLMEQNKKVVNIHNKSCIFYTIMIKYPQHLPLEME